MTFTQQFSPEDFDLSQYNLYFKQYDMNADSFGDGIEITLTFGSYGKTVEGLRNLSHDLKLVNQIHKATNSKSTAVKKHLDELEILLGLSNDNK